MLEADEQCLGSECHLLDSGASIRLVSQYLGHRSLKPTLVYLHLTEVNESSAREILGTFPGI